MESSRSTLLTHAPLNTTGHLSMLIMSTGNVQSIFKNGPIAISACSAGSIERGFLDTHASFPGQRTERVHGARAIAVQVLHLAGPEGEMSDAPKPETGRLGVALERPIRRQRRSLNSGHHEAIQVSLESA
jgi:hypothetical protein